MFNRILFLSLLALLLIIGVQTCVISRKSTLVSGKESIAGAITDSVRYYQDRLGREVAEKRGIQASLKAAETDYKLLTFKKQLLVRDIQALPRQERKKLVAGTSVQQQVTVHVADSVLVPSPFRLAWRKATDTLNYHIYVRDSTLTIDTLSMPNRLFLAHYVGSDKALHIRVTNSNPAFKTNDIDALVPPAKRANFWARLLAVFVPE